MSSSVGQRRGSDPELLWLWHRPATAALMRHLVWEPPDAAGAALKRQKTKKKEREREREVMDLRGLLGNVGYAQIPLTQSA